PLLVAASLCATVHGRRLHVEDVLAGADLAQAAARRRTPLDLIRAHLGALALRRRRAAGQGRWHRGDELILGSDGRGRLVSIPCGSAAGGMHTLLVGATGSGKTVTQTWMAVRSIERGTGAVVVDPKGDRDMRDAIAAAARAAGRDFIEWSPEGPCVYNPFARGGDTEIADKALAGERFTEPHYLRQAQRMLGHVVRALRAAGAEVHLRSIVANLDPGKLEDLARELPCEDAEATEAYLDSLTTRQRSELSGVRDRLAIIAESDVGQWLDSSASQARQFDLLQAVQDRAVVYFDLDADSRPLLTQMLGAAIVQDLQSTVAALQGRPQATIVVIDEFSTLAAEHVVRLFARARSAGFSLVLSTQELSDLRLRGREGLLEQVMGNLSVVLAHRQVVPSSAELIASLAGTSGAWRTSRQGDGRVSRTRVRTGALDADAVMSLAAGCAAVIVLSDGRPARIARVMSVDGRRRPDANGQVNEIRRSS
ncbi:MAG TPA: type IV secretion system DNA-binding domain-containing protein, partial [Solirubrobacteraceae bacterium]|nr:type IV secretion system DNA-binding domain-containing protein [Solirubrobacteraceae bacterium]